MMLGDRKGFPLVSRKVPHVSKQVVCENPQNLALDLLTLEKISCRELGVPPKGRLERISRADELALTSKVKFGRPATRFEPSADTPQSYR
jgi:hypothetical protein